MRVSLGFAVLAALGFVSYTIAGPIQTTGHGAQGGVPDGGTRDATYSVDDGTSDDSVGLGATSANDLVWLNNFPRIVGAENIVSISVIFGTPLFATGATNGTPIRILLYNDPTGGDPSDGVLLQNVAAVVANANTNIFNTYAIPATGVGPNFAVGVLMPNALGATNPFPAGFDTTDPDLPARSWIGFAGPNAVNPANLAGTIPAGQRGFIEAFGLPGNWMVRANGVAIPEPASMGLIGLGLTLLAARRRRA